MDEAVITITFIANTGVLMCYAGVRMLLDGIQFHQIAPFDSTPDELYLSMLKGEGEWRDIDYLLFSHEHPDHFSPAKTIPYIESNRVRGVFLPQSGSDALLNLHKTLLETNTSRITLTPDSGNRQFELVDGITLHVIPTRHMGEAFQDAEHYSFFCSLGGKGVLFTGDAEPLPENFGVLANERVDVAFVNPLFFHDKRGREALDTVIKPKQVKLYHLPFQSDSAPMHERLARSDIRRHPSAHYTVELFNRKNESMRL